MSIYAGGYVALLYCQNCAETHLLVEIYVDPSSLIATCKDWFCRFRNGNYDTKDKDHERQTKEFNDNE